MQIHDDLPLSYVQAGGFCKRMLAPHTEVIMTDLGCYFIILASNHFRPFAQLSAN